MRWPWQREERAAEVDAAALLLQLNQLGGGNYGWQVSPAILVGDIGQGAAPVSLEYNRRLAVQSPLLKAYQSCMLTGMLTGEAEAPVFDDAIPEALALAASEIWQAWHREHLALERDALRRVMVEGDTLLLDDALVPADMFEAVTSEGSLCKVIGFRIGRGSRLHRPGFRVFYLGDCSANETRARPWIQTAMPYAAALLNIRIAAAHGLGALAKLAAIIENASPDRVTAATAGHRSGVVRENPEEPDRKALQSYGIGSVPLMKLGEKIARIQAGPDDTARNYESQLEADLASALNLPLSELKSDYSSGSFSNLRMAWQDAEREYRTRRTWWHQTYRIPAWRELLTDAIAAGRLSGIDPKIHKLLQRPSWPGPRREPPQPEKEIQMVATLAKAGLTLQDAKDQLNQ